MLRSLKKYSTIPVLALSLAVWGCENTDQMLAPGDALQTTSTTTGNGYTIYRETNADVGTVSGVIGSAGGKLVLGKHELTVPAGAVDAPATFSMSKGSDELRFRLHATRNTTNDVGAAGFAAPVTLTISYANASVEASKEDYLKVFWIKNDGTIEVQPTAVEKTGKKLKGTLNHFSDYGGGLPGRCDPSSPEYDPNATDC